MRGPLGFGSLEHERVVAQACAGNEALAQAAALCIEGRRALLGHWVEASIQPLQRSVDALRHLDAHRGRPVAHELAIDALAHLNVALETCTRRAEAAGARAELQCRLAEGATSRGEALGLWFMSCAAQLRGDVPAMLWIGEKALDLVHGTDPPLAGPHRVLYGWALVMDGDVEDGLATLDVGLARCRRQGPGPGLPWLTVVAAEARLAAGAVHEARQDIDAAVAALGAGEPEFMPGAVWRIQGNLHWAAGDGLAAAQPDWERALAIDQAAGALLGELQTALALGRALRACGATELARDRLSGVLRRVDAGAGGPLLELANRQLLAWS
jgi:hypothetical protein